MTNANAGMGGFGVPWYLSLNEQQKEEFREDNKPHLELLEVILKDKKVDPYILENTEFFGNLDRLFSSLKKYHKFSDNQKGFIDKIVAKYETVRAVDQVLRLESPPVSVDIKSDEYFKLIYEYLDKVETNARGGQKTMVTNLRKRVDNVKNGYYITPVFMNGVSKYFREKFTMDLGDKEKMVQTGKLFADQYDSLFKEMKEQRQKAREKSITD